MARRRAAAVPGTHSRRHARLRTFVNPFRWASSLLSHRDDSIRMVRTEKARIAKPEFLALAPARVAPARWIKRLRSKHVRNPRSPARCRGAHGVRHPAHEPRAWPLDRVDMSAALRASARAASCAASRPAPLAARQPRRAYCSAKEVISTDKVRSAHERAARRARCSRCSSCPLPCGQTRDLTANHRRPARNCSRRPRLGRTRRRSALVTHSTAAACSASCPRR